MIVGWKFALAVILLVFGVAAACPASTVMVSVRADFSAAAISPGSMLRAKQMVSDIETSLMDEFFAAGHITFNLPLPIRTPASTDKAPTIDELLWNSAKGGADVLVYCTVQLVELNPNEPIQVKTCSVSALGVREVKGLPLNWKLPVTLLTRETDIQPDITRTAVQISAHL